CSESTARADAELLIRVRQMLLDGVDADDELGRDLLVGEPGSRQARDALLGLGERARRCRPPRAHAVQLAACLFGPTGAAERPEDARRPLERRSLSRPLLEPPLHPAGYEQRSRLVEPHAERAVVTGGSGQERRRRLRIAIREASEQPPTAIGAREPPRMRLLVRYPL